MKKRFKFSLIGALVGCAALFTAAGCSLNKSADDIKEEYNLNACVTYYANGGCFNSKAEKTEVTLWMDAESGYPYNVPSDNAELNAQSNHAFGKGTMEVSRKGYIFQGWYYAKLDDNGEVVFDEKGNVVADGKVDFSDSIDVGEHLYFVAKWAKKEVVEIRLVVENNASFEATVEDIDADGNQIKDSNGSIQKVSKSVTTDDIIMLKEYSTTSKTVKLSYSSEPASKVSGFTFFAYYSDAACTQMLTGDGLTLRPLGNEENQVVYAKYIEGAWTVIRSADDKDNLFDTSMSKNYWLLTDLDFNGKQVLSGITLSGKIVGNGHTIRGAQFVPSYVSENSTHAIFKEIKAGASISDLKFENCVLKVSANPNTVRNLTTYYFCASVKDGASLTDVTIKGGSLTVEKGEASIISNIQGEDRSNYLFGGEGTDTAFLTKYSGLTVEQQPELNIVNK